MGKAAIQAIAGIFVFFMLCKGADYLYVQEDGWSRILGHNFYKQKKNIDYVYFGSSHVYCDLNPNILDEKNGGNNFNLSTGSQPLNASYYLLKEADRLNNIEQVFLELYYRVSTGETGDYENDTSNGWKNVDYMKFSFNKIDAIYHMNPKEYYMDACFPFIRYREHLTDADWIKNVTANKSTDNYKNYIYNDGTTEYRDKGYYYTTRELSNLLYAMERQPEEISMTEDAEEYLRKIIEYCQQRNIPITLFSSPIYELQLISVEHYDDYVSQVEKIAGEYGVPYYDFNLVKEDYLQVQEPKYFMDVGHLNASGAETYTDFFYAVVSAKPEQNEKYFYSSYQEKSESTRAEVFGLYYRTAKEEELKEGEEAEKTKKITIASNRDKELKYQIYLMPEDKETVLLQDFSTEKEFFVPLEEHGICRIFWREEGKNIDWLDVEY